MKIFLVVASAAAALALSASPLVLAQSAERYTVIPPSDRQMRQLQALTPEGVAEQILIEDDDLEVIATLTTLDAWQSNGRFTDQVKSDNFLRAFVNKATGATSFQLYQIVTYSDDWRRFATVNYITSNGPKTAELDQIAAETIACYAEICTHRETVGFMVPREVLEEVASTYTPSNSPFWRFRFKARSGFDWEDRMSPAEAAGMLLAADRFNAQRSEQ